jgi:ATP-dependent Clp protease adaptor protein ClpS
MTPPSKTVAPPKLERQQEESLEPLYNVVLLDDDQHTYDYVVEMLQKLFCHSMTDAFQHAVEVDMSGRTVVITCGRSEAEFGRDQIHAYGPDPRIPSCKGSMKALIEPAGKGPNLHENN